VGHFANAADRNRDIGVGRGLEPIEEIDVRNFPEQFVLRTNSIPATRGGNLQVKMADQITVWLCRSTFDKQSRRL